jgi:hypothetical protein
VIEAGKVAKLRVNSAHDDIPHMQPAANKRLVRGVRREGIIHFEASAVVADKSGAVHH